MQRILYAKNTVWVIAYEAQVEIETNKDAIKIDPYACEIHVKGKHFDVTKTVAHIPREISRHAYFFIKEKEGRITGKGLSI